MITVRLRPLQITITSVDAAILLLPHTMLFSWRKPYDDDELTRRCMLIGIQRWQFIQWLFQATNGKLKAEAFSL